MAQNPNNPTGLPTSEDRFPITAYDKPQYALANLARGRGGAAVRSLFKPQTLSPEELQKFSDLLLKGTKGEENKFLKTVINIATNPITIMGVLLSVAYPMAGPRTIEMVAAAAKKTMSQPGVLTWWLQDAMARFRNLPQLLTDLPKLYHATKKFEQTVGEPIFRAKAKYEAAYGRLSRFDSAVMGAYLDGWHMPNNPIQQGWAYVGKPSEVMKGQYILDKLKPEVKELADVIRGSYTKGWQLLTGNMDDKMSKKMLSHLREKGIDMVANYHPHLTGLSHWEWAIRTSGNTGNEMYRQMLKAATSEKLAFSVQQRLGKSLPDAKSLQILKAGGAIDDGLVAKLEGIRQSEIKRLNHDLTTLVNHIIESRGGDYTKGKQIAFENLEAQLSHYFEKSTVQAAGRIREQGLSIDAARNVSKELFRFIDRPEDMKKAIETLSNTIGSPPQYTMDALDAAQGYIRATAPTYAWHGTGIGPGLIKYINENPNASQLQKNFFHDDLAPMLVGVKTYKQAARSMVAKSMKASAADWVAFDPMAKKYLPEDLRTNLLGFLADNRGSLTDVSIGSAVNHWFYLSTLGLNLSPANKNVLQNLMTTSGLVPFKDMLGGLGTVSKRTGQFWQNMGKMGADDAFQKAFPEFVKMHPDTSHMMAQMMASDMSASGAFAFERGGKTWEAAKKVMMFPFTTSEKFNRLWSFYGSLNSTKAAQALGTMSKTDALDYAARIVSETQFTGGPTGLPGAILNTWPPMRQFMHFPLRYAGFLANSVTKGPDPSRLDFGTIGRVMAATSMAYETGKTMFGVDLSPGLMTGALPAPSFEGAPFYPWPLVPPIGAVAGTVAMGIGSGDYSKLPDAAAMVIPGGLALRRAYKAYSPKFADYRNRGDDGRIPIYNKDHALVGSYTPWQLTKKAMGIAGNDVRGEQDAMNWLLRQRDRIRAYRREYLEAMTNNDKGQMDSLQKDFAKQYPKFGPLQVKKADIKAVQNRRQLSRLYRTLKGFPAEYREEFQRVVDGAAFASIIKSREDGGDFGLESYLQDPSLSKQVIASGQGSMAGGMGLPTNGLPSF